MLKDGVVYTDGKYPNNNVDYIGIRLAEMYLTRAESNIMVNNTVAAQDVSDVNAVKNRAGASDVVSGTPGKSAMLEIIFNERSKELYNETGDRFFNSRRLQKSIVNEIIFVFSIKNFIGKKQTSYGERKKLGIKYTREIIQKNNWS